MKATIEIPNELYRQVKAKSALEGRAVREVTIELYQTWLTQNEPPAAAVTPEEWLAEWLRMGEETLRSAAAGPTATEILADDRNRLERR